VDRRTLARAHVRRSLNGGAQLAKAPASLYLPAPSFSAGVRWGQNAERVTLSRPRVAEFVAEALALANEFALVYEPAP
jgi:hypothetical protein